MLVCKIWSVNCDKKHWEDQENGPEVKKTALGVCELFLSETVLEKELNL